MKHLHNVIMPLEGLAGSLVKDIAADMLEAAQRLGIMVSLDMNGTHLLAVPGMTIDDIREDYEAQLAAKDHQHD